MWILYLLVIKSIIADWNRRTGRDFLAACFWILIVRQMEWVCVLTRECAWRRLFGGVRNKQTGLQAAWPRMQTTWKGAGKENGTNPTLDWTLAPAQRDLKFGLTPGGTEAAQIDASSPGAPGKHPALDASLPTNDTSWESSFYFLLFPQLYTGNNDACLIKLLRDWVNSQFGKGNCWVWLKITADNIKCSLCAKCFIWAISLKTHTPIKSGCYF